MIFDETNTGAVADGNVLAADHAAETGGAAPLRSIGILGAGRVGTALARLGLKAGLEVQVATTRPPADIQFVLDVMVPGARAQTSRAVAEQADLVVLALPLSRALLLSPESFAGKAVVDLMNFWAPTDAPLPSLRPGESSSEMLQRHLSGARIVRTLNHIGCYEYESDARPKGDPERRALALAGNDPIARLRVAEFLDRIGFDPVDADALRNARRFEPGTDIFEGRWQRDELIGRLAEAS